LTYLLFARSPGYGLTVVAETTTGSLYSTECTFQPRLKDDEKESIDETSLQLALRLQELYNFQAPEDLGSRIAKSLLNEISKGGCFPSCCQWLVCLLITLCPEDVSKVRFGKLEPITIQYLRDLKDFFGVTFKIKPDEETKSVLLTGMGVGYVNVNKKTA
jgi:RNA 3'-terminal phosphate cyclase-like protein